MSESETPVTLGPEAPPAAKAAKPAGPIRSLYREEREAWRRHYKRYFKLAARALGLGFVAGFLYFMLWPAQEKKALEYVVNALKHIPIGGSPLVLALTLFSHNARASVVAIAAGIVPFLYLSILDPLVNGAVLGLLASVSKHNGLDVPRLILTQILPHGVFELTAVCYATSLGLYLSAGMSRKAATAWQARKSQRGAGTCTSGTALLGSPEPRGTCPPSAPASAPSSLPPDAGTAPAASPDFPAGCHFGVAAGPEGLVRNIVRSFALVVLPLLLVAAVIEGFITPHLR